MIGVKGSLATNRAAIKANIPDQDDSFYDKSDSMIARLIDYRSKLLKELKSYEGYDISFMQQKAEKVACTLSLIKILCEPYNLGWTQEGFYTVSILGGTSKDDVLLELKRCMHRYSKGSQAFDGFFSTRALNFWLEAASLYNGICASKPLAKAKAAVTFSAPAYMEGPGIELVPPKKSTVTTPADSPAPF